MNSGPLLHTEDLPSPLRNHIGASEPVRIGPEPSTAVLPLCEIEKRAILEALDHTKGDLGTAAHLAWDRPNNAIPQTERVSAG